MEERFWLIYVEREGFFEELTFKEGLFTMKCGDIEDAERFKFSQRAKEAIKKLTQIFHEDTIDKKYVIKKFKIIEEETAL